MSCNKRPGNKRLSESDLSILPEVKQGLCLNHCHLVGICGEGMNMQLGASGLKINVAKRLQFTNFQLGEFDKHATVPSESLKINVALAIQIRAHLFDLEVGHIADAAAQGALVTSRAAKLKTLYQATLRK